jgi:hypothetical protein
MAEFLSDEWIAALDAAARAAPDLAVDDALVVEQVVQITAERAVRYRVQFGPDGAAVARTGDTAADVVLVTDRATAWALHQGERRAQDAFARGELKVRGRPELLSGRSDLFGRLQRAWSAVRDTTTRGDA